MAYESRIFIVNRSELDNDDGTTYVYAQQIADINMGRMDEDFLKLFNKEIDYELFIKDGDDSTQTDGYGDIMKYTDCKTVITLIEKLIDNGDDYRRLPMLLGLLKGINEKQWDNIQVVHYGY